MDTRSSRTAKKAPTDLRDAMVATRAEKIYRPADEATINKVTPILESKGLLRRGTPWRWIPFPPRAPHRH